MRKSKLGIAAAAVAGAVGITLFATPSMAFASGGASVGGSSAYWNSATNTVSSTDTRKDGISSVAQLQYTLNRRTYTATLTNSNGTGTTSAAQNSGIGGTVYLRACLNNRSANTGIYGCSGWVALAA